MQIRRVIRRAEVISKTGLSRCTINNMEKRGEFPKHFLLTPRCAVWDEAEVEAWLAQRRAAATSFTTSNKRSAAGHWEGAAA